LLVADAEGNKLYIIDVEDRQVKESKELTGHEKP